MAVMPVTAGYGSWKSPVTPDMILSRSIGLGQIETDGEYIYWVESRPAEEGRSVIVRRQQNGEIKDITPLPHDVRTRVHEYGGGAFSVFEGTIYFSNNSDQRLYRQRPGCIPVPLTPAGNSRYADSVLDSSRRSLVCVCEEHTGKEVKNSLVRINVSGNGEVTHLVSGNDFYAAPRINPEGSRLVWLTWNHPHMPWDSSELWLGEISPDGRVINPRKIAGGKDESICQPEFSPDGTLYFVSDRTGWWNLYRWKEGKTESVYEMQAEFAVPQWVFAVSRYGFSSAGSITCSFIQNGKSILGSLDLNTNESNRVPFYLD